ncbi:hypothetical protein DM02DRAFT_548309, partial [Periconia macrospinosa]
MGLLSLQKGDFYPLFRSAWTTAFRKDIILSSFAATGLHPFEPERVLKRFRKRATNEADDAQQREHDVEKHNAQRVGDSVHHLAVTNELLQHEIDGIKEALFIKKQRNKPANTLPL